jgi:cellulose biosynthesis protein BcsQ
MIKEPSSGILHRSSLALVNFKGGAGKTVLTGNIAAIAAKVLGWNVCVIDLDASAPLTKLAINDIPAQASIKEALGRAARGESLSNILSYAPTLGFWLLPGSVKGVSGEEVRHLPRLVQALKECRLPDGEIDLVVIDTPGENKVINGAVLASVDHVAMPLTLNATDMTATAVTISFVRQMQQKREGKPVFLGLIPNRVQRRGTYEKAFLDQVLEVNTLLPYIPDSNIIKGSFAKASQSGGEVPIYFAPKAAATQRLVHLFSEMNNPHKDFAGYEDEIRGFLELPAEINERIA